MKIQRPKRITTENIVGDEAKEAVDNVGYSQNTFNDEVYSALAGRLNIADNLNMAIKVVTTQVNASGVPKNALTFKSNINSKTQGIICIRGLLATVTSMPFLTFIDNSGVITVSHISGLTADTDYQLVLLIIGD